MGSVDDCVSRKLSQHGGTPTDQDLAIKFSECREEQGETLIGDKTHEKMFLKKFTFKEVAHANEAMNRALVGKTQGTETDTSTAPQAGTSKQSVNGMAFNFHDRIFVNDEAMVAGSAFDNNFSQEIMTKIAEVLDEQPYTKVTKEFLLIELSRKGMDPMKVNEFIDTNILLAGEKDRGNDPNFPEIKPTSHSNQDGTTVPNVNAFTNFKPEDTLFGGTKREDVIDDNSIKSGFGSMDPRGNAGEVGKFGTMFGAKSFPFGRRANDDKKEKGERLHHIARSVMNGGGFEAGTSQALMEPFPNNEPPQLQDDELMLMVQNLIMQGIPEEQAVQMVIDGINNGMGEPMGEQPMQQPMMEEPIAEQPIMDQPMEEEPQVLATEPHDEPNNDPCQPGSMLNQVSGQCEPIHMEDNDDLDVLGTPPQILSVNATDAMMGNMGRMNQPVRVPVTEIKEPTAKEFDCGCLDKTAEAIKTIYGKAP